MNQAKNYIYDFLVDILDKYDMFINNETNTINFWEKVFKENPDFKKEVENYLKKINLLKEKKYNEKDIINVLVYDYYDDYYVSLDFDNKRKENLYYKMLKFIDESENYIDSMLLSSEKESLIKKYIKENGYVLNYAFRGGFIFNDGSVLDIGDEDHRIINFDYSCKKGIVTYRIINKGDLYIRYIKNNFFYKQKQVIKDIIEQFNIDQIHYEMYNENARMLKQKSIDVYDYNKIFERKREKNVRSKKFYFL